MLSITKIRSLLGLGILTVATVVSAANTADPNADVVQMRKDCGTLENCFDNVGSLANWIWGTRLPDASSPLLVEIGPGTFSGNFRCNNAGHVTLRGSGRDHTLLAGFGLGTVDVTNCDKLAFENMSFSGFYTVFWRGGGSSTWTNVDVTGTAFGWYDEACPSAGDKPPHYWFGSRITSTGVLGLSIPYFSQCGDNWFYGGELNAFAPESLSNMGRQDAVAMYDQGEIRIFGSAVRSIANPAATTVYPAVGLGGREALGLVGVSAVGGGVVHLHGSIVNVNGTGADPNVDREVAAIFTDGANSAVHAPGTAYTVIANGAGPAHRILGNGSVAAPFTWPNGTEPPPIRSMSGADVFVETDCTDTGDCDSAGSEVHMMIHAPDECGTANPWFDTRRNACRM